MVYMGCSIYSESASVKPSRVRITNLLRGRLQRQGIVGSIVNFFDLLGIRHKDIAVVGSEQLKRLPTSLVKGLLDDFRTPKKVRPCLVAFGQRSEEVAEELPW